MMTTSEAIKNLEGLKYIFRTCMPKEKAEALDMAIETLEKEILHKPIKSTDRFNDNILMFHCPTCNGYIGHGNRRTGVLNKFTVSDIRCGYCGQMIDWSGWNDKGTGD